MRKTRLDNTMNDGMVVVHGRCGDAAGYAMRGGTTLFAMIVIGALAFI